MSTHPTPQRSGRTADDILIQLMSGIRTNEFPKGIHVAVPSLDLLDVKRQLFDAMVEIVNEHVQTVQHANGRADFIDTYNLDKLQNKLRIFFNQPEASGKDGGK